MLERVSMYMPKTCKEGHTCFETWLKYVKKDSRALKHNEKGLHVLKDATCLNMLRRTYIF
jgi:hypothetical protein